MMMAAPAFDLRRAPPLAEQIYQRLRFQLRSGAFAPGERLIESSLAQELSVSRSPVREALSRLTADGLLQSGSGGFQVAMPTREDMMEIFEMRRLLEPAAAGRVAGAATPELLKELDDAVSRARAAQTADDFTAFTEANYGFRAAWVSRVTNQRLRETILRFDDQAGHVRRQTLVLPAARADALALLEQYRLAFSHRDSAEAATVTLRFIEAAERYYGRVAQTSDQTV